MSVQYPADILKVQLALAEAHQSQLRAAYFQQRIATGVWKEKVGQVRKGGFEGPLASEDEVLSMEVDTMLRHIHRAEEHLDHVKELLA